MKLLKPSWVHHDDKPIFSVDVHQECLKFATGGQGMDSGRVVIWNLLPVLSEKAEMDVNVPKVLCQMDQHLGCVNCVRWSPNGQMLASGSDDKLIMIWRKSHGTSGVFCTGGMKKNPESWKCAYTLRGHAGDILDLAWSPYGSFLASCSIDNTIIVWDAHSFPVIAATLKGHAGLVKGVCWDPVGKFVASQSDDRSIKVWRTSDWSCNTTIKEPFEECGGTTHILRLSWSPDGQYLVSAHAMNGGGPTAQIIEREGWRCDKDFVGHRKAVTCVRFHSSILKSYVTVSNKNTTKKVQQYCCLAVGSRDRSLSVWMTALQRPSVVIHDIFNDSILDLSWGPQKCVLMACSGDGTVACLQFSDDELGAPLSEEDQNRILKRMYGKNFTFENGVSNNVVNTIVENPEYVNLPPDTLKSPALPKVNASNPDFIVGNVQPTTVSKQQSIVTADSPFKILKQKETRTIDGKRRITPMFIPINQDINSTPTLNSSSRPINSNSCSNGIHVPPSTINNDTLNDDNVSQQDTDDPITVSADYKDVTSSVLDSRILIAQPAAFNENELQNFPLVINNQAKRRPYVQQLKNFTNYQANTCGPKLNITPATKCEFIKSALDYRIVVKNGFMKTNNGFIAKAAAYCVSTGNHLWELFVGSPIVNLNFCLKYAMLCSLDGTVRLLNMQTGCSVLPALTLTSAAVQCSFCPKGIRVGVITECGILRIWHIVQERVTLATTCQEVLSKFGAVQQFVITEEGIPLIGFVNGDAYSYSEHLQSWLVVSSKDPVTFYSLRATLPREIDKNYQSYPLLTTQVTALNCTLLVGSNDDAEDWQPKAKISFLENQIKLCKALNSPEELKYWYHALAYHLALCGTEKRIRLMLDDLLGTPDISNSIKCEIMTISKHQLFESVLEILKPHVQWQRVYTEYIQLYKYFEERGKGKKSYSDLQKKKKKKDSSNVNVTKKKLNFNRKIC